MNTTNNYENLWAGFVVYTIVHRPSPSIETLISRNAKEVKETSQVHIFKSRMKRIDSGYKLIEVLSGRRGSAETVVNVATVKFRFGPVVY